jgi:hypothetical protein
MTKPKTLFLPLILFMWISVHSNCFTAEQAKENDSWSKLRINEILASNISNIKDEKSEDEDWVEIHNGGDAPVNMGGNVFF